MNKIINVYITTQPNINIYINVEHQLVNGDITMNKIKDFFYKSINNINMFYNQYML